MNPDQVNEYLSEIIDDAASEGLTIGRKDAFAIFVQELAEDLEIDISDWNLPGA